MPTIVFDREWVVEAGLREKTGLTERQITSYRQIHWAEDSISNGSRSLQSWRQLQI